MTEYTTKIGNHSIITRQLNTVIVGTGAAGYNTAKRLFQAGQTDIAIVTEHVLAGTSRNTGSDKQTYYKLTLSGGDGDSVLEMAQTLFSGGCVDGDHALCEAALSAQSFLHLAELGVPFPRTRYGEYAGYKTDHDPRRRATSAGPYTSKMMTESLQNSCALNGICVFDNMQVIRILSNKKQVCGLLCLDLQNQKESQKRLVAFHCKNVVYATGGPAGMYADSVYPQGHYGSSGLAFEAGVHGKNLTEWQYGLASTKPRWNVSGTYMQVLPRFISTAHDGSDEQEFLADFFTDSSDMLSKVFLKGYQWPFDVRKIENGSSIIDILVYLETCKGRRVFLDFTKNPAHTPINFDSLNPEASEYLHKAGACFGTPIERLLHMNTPAVDFYRDKGVDLTAEPLEIALCAQHNNGGLSIDSWWHTNVEGFFAAGEVSASHGIYRPGGSALNAGQVGSTRAAQFIAACRQGTPQTATLFEQLLANAAVDFSRIAKNALNQKNTAQKTPSNVRCLWKEAAELMSRYGGPIRNSEGIITARSEIRRRLDSFENEVHIEAETELHTLCTYRDTLIAQYVYLTAMADYMQNGGKSRGSALYTDKNGTKPYACLDDTFTFTLDDGTQNGIVREIEYDGHACTVTERNVRPIPAEDDFFENIWRSFRENGNVY